jgi:glutamine synthetase
MSTLRFQALKDASGRKPVKFEESGEKNLIFWFKCFNDKQ